MSSKPPHTLQRLAEHYREHGNCKKAEMIYKSLLSKENAKTTSKLETANPQEIAALTSGLANVYTTAQDYAKALPMLKKAVKVNAKVHGHAAHQLTVPYHNIGECHRQNANYATAEKWLKRSVGSAEHKRFYAGPKDFQGEKQTFLALADCYQKRGDHQLAFDAKARAKAKECDVRQVPVNSSLHYHTTSTSLPSFSMQQAEFLRLRQASMQVPIPSQRQLLMQMQDQPPKRPHTSGSILSQAEPATYVRTSAIEELTRKQKCRVRARQKTKTQRVAAPRNPKPRVRKGRTAGLAVDAMMKDALRQGLHVLVQQISLHPMDAELTQRVAHQLALEAQEGGPQQRRVVAAGAIPTLAEALQRHSSDSVVAGALAMALHGLCVRVRTSASALQAMRARAAKLQALLKREQARQAEVGGAADFDAEERVEQLKAQLEGALPTPMSGEELRMHRDMAGDMGAVEALLSAMRRHGDMALAPLPDGTTTCTTTAAKKAGRKAEAAGGGGKDTVGDKLQALEKLITALHVLCIGSASNKERAVEAHALPTLLHMLRQHVERSTLCTKCIACLAAIAAAPARDLRKRAQNSDGAQAPTARARSAIRGRKPPQRLRRGKGKGGGSFEGALSTSAGAGAALPFAALSLRYHHMLLVECDPPLQEVLPPALLLHVRHPTIVARCAQLLQSVLGGDDLLVQLPPLQADDGSRVMPRTRRESEVQLERRKAAEAAAAAAAEERFETEMVERYRRLMAKAGVVPALVEALHRHPTNDGPTLQVARALCCLAVSDQGAEEDSIVADSSVMSATSTSSSNHPLAAGDSVTDSVAASSAAGFSTTASASAEPDATLDATLGTTLGRRPQYCRLITRGYRRGPSDWPNGLRLVMESAHHYEQRKQAADKAADIARRRAARREVRLKRLADKKFAAASTMKTVEEEEAEARGDVVAVEGGEGVAAAAAGAGAGTTAAASTANTTATSAAAATASASTNGAGAGAGGGAGAYALMAVQEEEEAEQEIRGLGAVEVFVMLKGCFPAQELEAMMDALYEKYGWYASESESSDFDSSEDERQEQRKEWAMSKKKKKKGRNRKRGRRKRKKKVVDSDEDEDG